MPKNIHGPTQPLLWGATNECATCRLTNPPLGFRQGQPGTVVQRCRVCNKKRGQRWREKQDPVVIRKKKREYAKANPEKTRQWFVSTYARSSDGAKRRAKEWAEKHPERTKERARQSHLRNKARDNERTQKWRIENKDRIYASIHKRRAKKTGSVEHFTAEEFQQLCEKYNHQCLRCGRCEPLTPDHVIPLCENGSNGIANIQPLCLPCNLWKRTADC